MLTGDITADAINDILSALSPSDMESITKLASEFLSGSHPNDSEKKEEPGSASPFNIDMDTVMKIASVMNRLSSQPEDPRCRLLRDLKPMLSPVRRKRVDNAIQMLQMISLMPLIRELS